jgi:hypothetical protein
MAQTPEMTVDQYIQRYVPGPGRYQRVIIEDWALKDPSGEMLRRMPVRGADRLVAAYVKSSVRPEVRVEVRAEVPPPTIGIPGGPAGEGHLLPSKKGVVYLSLTHLLRQGKAGELPGSVPVVGVWGDSEQIGKHHVTLDEPAPGDRPCSPYCNTADEAFAAVKGRIDIIIRSIRR